MKNPDDPEQETIARFSALLKEADEVRRSLPGWELHVGGWNNARPGEFATVRPRSLFEDVSLDKRT